MTQLPISTGPCLVAQLSKYMHRCVLGAINQQKQPMVLDHVQAELLRKCWELGHEMGSLPSRIEKVAKHNNKDRDKAFYQQLWKTKADRRKDGARSAVVSSIVSYERLKDADRLFYAWTMDARGRLYANGDRSTSRALITSAPCCSSREGSSQRPHAAAGVCVG